MKDDSNELSFPIIKNHSIKRSMSMDEYDEFIEHDLRNAFDLESYKREKLKRVVTVPFRIEDK
jgi:hypothetical protein